MWPHGAPAPRTPLEQLLDGVSNWFDGLDPMAILLAMVGVCIVVMLVVAIDSEEGKQ